jgi:hypothetical protein
LPAADRLQPGKASALECFEADFQAFQPLAKNSHLP